MLKAVVFDDEYIVLKGLQTMIDWAGFGISLAGTATDGCAAIDLVRRVRPDVVLTDIRMPGMDGLQLIEQVLREAPETYCIVFSGYNEFAYVKRAIQLGVADYLEKPITVPGIEAAIRKMMERIGQRQSRERELLEKATLDLLLAGEAAAPLWRIRFGARQAECVVGSTVLACSDEFPLPADDESYRIVRVRNGPEHWVAVFHFRPPTHEFWERLEQAAEGISGAAGAGRTHPGVAGAPDSRREAQRALRAARFLGERFVRFEELGEAFTSDRALSEREEAILLHLRTGNRTGLMEEVDRLLAWFHAGKADPETVENEMLKVIYLAREAARESGIEPTSVSTGGDMPHVEIRKAAAEGRLAAWFRERIGRIADQAAEARDRKKHAAVERALRYIERNVTRDLSLQEVAEHVGMNAAYLSALFKDVMGETYIKYLTRRRMELAKALLAKGMKVNEVSERVGYHNYRHFSELFKKYTGTTPGQYKDR